MKFAEKWKNFTEKVNNLSLTIYDVIIRDRFFPNRPVSGTFHRLEKKNVPEPAYTILLTCADCFLLSFLNLKEIINKENIKKNEQFKCLKNKKIYI